MATVEVVSTPVESHEADQATMTTESSTTPESASSSSSSSADGKKPKTKASNEKKNKIPVAKGIPKSGRVWKSTSKRSSALNVGKAYHKTWEHKNQERERLRLLKEKERAMKDEAQRKRDEEKQAAAERRKQKEENERKSSVVQTIKDTRKIKKMKRSQLKLLEKR